MQSRGGTESRRRKEDGRADGGRGGDAGNLWGRLSARSRKLADTFGCRSSCLARIPPPPLFSSLLCTSSDPPSRSFMLHVHLYRSSWSSVLLYFALDTLPAEWMPALTPLMVVHLSPIWESGLTRGPDIVSWRSTRFYIGILSFRTDHPSAVWPGHPLTWSWPQKSQRALTYFSAWKERGPHFTLTHCNVCRGRLSTSVKRFELFHESGQNPIPDHIECTQCSLADFSDRTWRWVWGGLGKNTRLERVSGLSCLSLILATVSTVPASISLFASFYRYVVIISMAKDPRSTANGVGIAIGSVLWPMLHARYVGTGSNLLFQASPIQIAQDSQQGSCASVDRSTSPALVEH